MRSYFATTLLTVSLQNGIGHSPALSVSASNSSFSHARVPRERIPTSGTYEVTVVTPWSGGGTSNAEGLTAR